MRFGHFLLNHKHFFLFLVVQTTFFMCVFTNMFMDECFLFVPDLTNPTFLCWSLFHVLRNICSLFFNFCSYFLVPSVFFLPFNFSYAQSFIFVSCVNNYVPSSLIFVPNSCFVNFFPNLLYAYCSYFRSFSSYCVIWS